MVSNSTASSKMGSSSKEETIIVDTNDAEKAVRRVYPPASSVRVQGAEPLHGSCAQDLVAVLQKNRTVNRLDLTNTLRSDEAAQILQTHFQQASCAIKELSFGSDNGTETSLEHIRTSLHDSVSIQRLTCSHLDLTTRQSQDQFQSIMTNLSNLRELEFRSCDFGTNVSVLAEGFKCLRANLISFGLEGCQIMDPAAISLLQALCPQDEDEKAPICSTSLTRLNLGSYTLGSPTLAHVNSLLSSKSSHIQALRLSTHMFSGDLYQSFKFTKILRQSNSTLQRCQFDNPFDLMDVNVMEIEQCCHRNRKIALARRLPGRSLASALSCFQHDNTFDGASAMYLCLTQMLPHSLASAASSTRKRGATRQDASQD